jgi:hypothetical protein
MFTALSRPEISVSAGVIGAVALVLLARWLAPRGEMMVYAVGLGVTAVAYLVFAIQRGAPAGHLGFELVGAVLYGAAAVLGVRRWPALLAVGWTAHVGWDLFFHYASGPAFAPAWYALFCVGFDLPMGGYIAGLIAARSRRENRATAPLSL